MKDFGQNEIVHHFLTSKSGLGLGKKPVVKEMLIIPNYNSDETKSQDVQRNFHVIFLPLVPGSARVSMVMSIILVRGHSRGRFEGESTLLTLTSVRPPSPSKGVNDRSFCSGWIYTVA